MIRCRKLSVCWKVHQLLDWHLNFLFHPKIYTLSHLYMIYGYTSSWRHRQHNIHPELLLPNSFAFHTALCVAVSWYRHASHHTKGMNIRTQVLALFLAIQLHYWNNHQKWLFKKRYPGPISAHCAWKGSEAWVA